MSACFPYGAEVVDRSKISELDGDSLTQREIAAMMGISAAAVNRILKAHHSPIPAPPIV